MQLVDYPSSSDDDEGRPAERKRRLPSLSPSLTVPTPVDDPALHQGRVRTVPHVEGQYAAYVYVPVARDTLERLVDDALASAKSCVPSLHALGKDELHVSLSRPLFLRAHQREEFRRAVQQVASAVAPFDASFASFSELTNDERTRTFLALQVGAGHGELRRCLDLLAPTLRSLRQKEFYVDPKFHASIAWALLDAPLEREAQQTGPIIEQVAHDFHRIRRFPQSLVPLLNEAYGAKLSQARTGGFLVDRISAKIGKDVFTWSLNSMK